MDRHYYQYLLFMMSMAIGLIIGTEANFIGADPLTNASVEDQSGMAASGLAFSWGILSWRHICGRLGPEPRLSFPLVVNQVVSLLVEGKLLEYKWNTA